MFNINQALIAGNVTNDPELRYTQGGTAYLRFGVATNRGVKNKETEEWENVPTFHNVVVWGKLAENVGDRLHKGHLVTVLGRIDHSKYTDKDGVERVGHEIVADSVIAHAQGGKKANTEETTDNVDSEEIPF